MVSEVEVMAAEEYLEEQLGQRGVEAIKVLIRAERSTPVDGLRVVDRETLIRVYESQAWSSPDQMADMLLDGLRALAADPTASDDA